jgi:hypothetical protein
MYLHIKISIWILLGLKKIASITVAHPRDLE